MSNYKGIKNVSTIFFFFRATTQCFYTKYGIQKIPINNFAFSFTFLPKDNIFMKQWFFCFGPGSYVLTTKQWIGNYTPTAN